MLQDPVQLPPLRFQKSWTQQEDAYITRQQVKIT